MDKKHFDLGDNFGKIIKSRLGGVVSIEKIPTGWTNYVFKATTKDNRRFIFRFPRDYYWVETLAKEKWFNKFIKNKVPVLVVDLKYMRVGGRGFSMHEMIKGETLTEAYPKMNDKQRAALAGDIVDYIVALNKVDISKIKLPLCSEFNTGFAKMTNDPEFNYKEVFKPFYENEKDESRLVLSHGDFNNGNIIVDGDYRMVAVLDYAFAFKFIPGYADLSVLLARHSKDFYDIVVKQYEMKIREKIDKGKLDALINVRREIEKDYVKYMAKTHPDVILPV